MSETSPRPRQVMTQFAVLKDVTNRASLADTFERLGNLLAQSELRGSLKVQLLEAADADTGKRQERYFTIVVADNKVKIKTGESEAADVELITTPDTWWEIAAGKLAPHDAFFNGRMRIRGDFGLAQDMLKSAAASTGRTHLCKGAT
jgi:putative sterol carrier protein